MVAAALAVAACGYETHPGAVVWGTLEATAYEPIEMPHAVSLAPRGAVPADPAIEEQLAFSLGRRGIEVRKGARRVMRYLLHTVAMDAEPEGIGVLLGGTIGSSGSGTDLGLGLDWPLLSGGGETRLTAFLMELSLFDDDGTILWHGRAEGRSRARAPDAILQPVAPALLNWLGSDTRGRSFAR